MAVKLNLLPSDYEVSKPVATILKIVRPLNVILLAIFLTGALGLAGFFIFSSITLRDLNSANNNLKNQIQAQQTAQQQVVLLKDRLGKIQTVLGTPSAFKNLAAITPFANSLGDNSSVSELDISSQKTSLSVTFRTNSDLSNFMKNISSQGAFSGLTLDSFSYNPGSGYLVGFSFVGKNK